MNKSFQNLHARVLAHLNRSKRWRINRTMKMIGTILIATWLAPVTAMATLEVGDLDAGALVELTYVSPVHGNVELLIYSPPGFLQTGASDPANVLLWLHGSGGDHRSLIPVLEALPISGASARGKMDSVIDSGLIEPLIIVSIAAPGGSWTDELTGLVTQEIPAFIDRTFRTYGRQSGRAIEGFSLGSQGVSIYATARPDKFLTASLLGGGFLQQRYTDAQDALLRDATEFNLLVGDEDSFEPTAVSLAAHLDSLGVTHQLTILDGVSHSASEIYAEDGLANLQFHDNRFMVARIVYAGADQHLDQALPVVVALTGEVDDPLWLVGPFTSQWQQVSGPGAAVIDDDTALVTTATLPVAGTYHFRLDVSGHRVVSDVIEVVAIDSSDGLEAHLTFDTSDTTTDVTGNGHDGVTMGGPAFVADGRSGEALDFDGVDDAVFMPDFDYGPAWSLSLYMRADDLIGTGYQYLFSHGAFDVQPSVNLYLPEDSAVFAETPETLGASPLQEPKLEAPASKAPTTDPPALDAMTSGGSGLTRVRVALRDENDGSGSFTTATADLTDQDWHHLALVVSGAGGHQLFVDGESLSGGPKGGDAFDPDGDIFLGTRSVSPTDRYFDGSLDEVRLYTRELIAEELEQLTMVEEDEAAPYVDAGDDREIYFGRGVVLQGVVVDQSATTCEWTQVSGPGMASFADSSAPITSATFSATGIYVLRLSADDGSLQATDEVEIEVGVEAQPDLVADWRFEDGVGSQTLFDSSTLGHTGTAVGATPPTFVRGQDGLALRFDADEDQAVIINTSPLLDPDPAVDDFSIALWMRIGKGNLGSLISRGALNPGDRHYQIYLSDPDIDGVSDLYAIVGGVINEEAREASVKIDDYQWHHVTLVHDASEAQNQLWVDGLAIGQAAPSGTVTSDVSVVLGARRATEDDTGLARFLNGDLDEIRFYRKALSEAEIQQIMIDTSCQDPSCAVLFEDSFETCDTSGWDVTVQ